MAATPNPLSSPNNAPQTTSNSLIHHLPAELLAQIFGYLLEPLPEPFPVPLPDSFHDWKVVTQVCRYWRATALSTPSLWNRIHIGKISDEAALYSLPLTGNLPLEVYYTADLSEVPESRASSEAVEDEALKAVLANADRLRELHIFSSLTEAHSPWKYFTSPASLLECLTIISGEEDDAGVPYVLPPIFNAQTICMKKLVLANVSLWPHDSFHGLRRLELYDQLDEARLPLHTFLNTLGQSPQLETLIIVSAGLEDDFIFDTSDLAQPLSLPCLRYLELGEWSFEMVPLTFLKHIILPRETTLCLWNLGWESDLRNLLLPRPEDCSLLQRCTKINITCLLDGDYTCEVDTLIGVKDSTIYYYASTVPPGFSTLRSLGDFVNVTELNYCPESRWGKYGDIIDEDLLLMLPALKILRVSNAIWRNLDRLCNLLIQFELKPKQSQRSKSQSQTTAGAQLSPDRPRFRIAPLLEELHITHLYDHPDFQEPWTPYSFEDLQPLVLFANVRANNGVALKKLVVQGCDNEVRASSRKVLPPWKIWKKLDSNSLLQKKEGLELYFGEVVFLEKRFNVVRYWEDSVAEVWPRGKQAKPQHPDW